VAADRTRVTRCSTPCSVPVALHLLIRSLMVLSAAPFFPGKVASRASRFLVQPLDAARGGERIGRSAEPQTRSAADVTPRELALRKAARPPARRAARDRLL